MMQTLARLLALLVVGVGAAVMAPAPAASGVTPAASVQVFTWGREQQFDNFSGSVQAKCQPGYQFQELSMHGVQGSYSTDWQASAPSSFTCNGNWQRIRYSSGPGFVAGKNVTVTARLTVISSATGDPAPQAVHTATFWIRPATGLSINKYVTLMPDGTAVSRVWARCDKPWVEPDFSVTLSQDNHSSAVYPSITCDDAWHRFDVRTNSADGTFHTGAAQVDASLIVHDPNSFDPVAATQISRQVTIVN